MLTKDFLFGMNLLSLAGFVLMLCALNLGRQGRVRRWPSVALMGAGTALVFVGLYLHGQGG